MANSVLGGEKREGEAEVPAERALVLWGGYPGHQPREAVERFIPYLSGAGFDVIVKDSLDAYADTELMSSVRVILQNWTTGDLTMDQFEGLSAAVRAGAGLVGWHGGLCDAFRHLPAYQFMTGGQWLAHPGGSHAEYTVDIAAAAAQDPVMAGLGSFSITSEQYYLAVDPAVEVLATTTFRRPAEAPWIEEAVIPAVWRKGWAAGRIFYVSWGHQASDFDVDPARLIVERGLLWAAGRAAG
jgi:type 1 glutamine amidotransferase